MPSAERKARVTSLPTTTSKNGPKGLGAGRPKRPVKNSAAARGSFEWTMVWFSLTAMAAISDAEQLLERSRGRADRLRIGALLGLVLRRGKAVACAAVDLVLEGELRAAHLLDQAVDRRERKALILGAVQDQEHALGVRRPSRRAVAERAVNRDVRGERRTGRREFDADPAAETVADERDPRGVDHRILG